MDETRIVANQRLDLVDHTRLMAQLQEAFGDILGWLLGNPQYYSGGAADYQARPLIVYNFDITNPAGFTLRCHRQWTSGGNTYNALVYDKDGQRLTGPNSPTLIDYTVADLTILGTDRYLIARRVTTTTTNESRQFYTAAAGKTTTATDTRTIDSWVFSEGYIETGGVNTPAATNAGLQADGWVDVGIFQTDGMSITALTVNPSDILTARPLTWAVAPPDTDELPLNIFELLTGIQQILERMRNNRAWHDDPSYDATFESEGGIRLAGGTTLGRGLENIYIGAQNGAGGGSGQKLVVIEDGTIISGTGAGTANNFASLRSKVIIAGDSSGLPDTGATPSGFLYSSSVAPTIFPTHLQTIDKYWSVPACDMFIGSNNTGAHPWVSGGVPVVNNWYINDVSSGTALASNAYMEWRMDQQGGGPGPLTISQTNLYIPIKVPDKCRLHTVSLIIDSVGGVFSTSQIIALTIISQNGITLSNVSTPVYWNFPFGGGGIQTLSVSPTASTTIDNNTYNYYLLVRVGTDGVAAFAAQDTFGILYAEIRTQIREASHVY